MGDSREVRPSDKRESGNHLESPVWWVVLQRKMIPNAKIGFNPDSSLDIVSNAMHEKTSFINA